MTAATVMRGIVAEISRKPRTVIRSTTSSAASSLFSQSSSLAITCHDFAFIPRCRVALFNGMSSKEQTSATIFSTGTFPTWETDVNDTSLVFLGLCEPRR